MTAFEWIGLILTIGLVIYLVAALFTRRNSNDGPGLLQLALYVVVLVALVKPLGTYMARVYEGERTFLSPVLGPVERLIYRLAGVDPTASRTGSATRSACCWSISSASSSCTCCSGCRACCR